MAKINSKQVNKLNIEYVQKYIKENNKDVEKVKDAVSVLEGLQKRKSKL
jgi:hypothetical protein